MDRRSKDRPKRGYDRGFQPMAGEWREFKISRIPVDLWDQVQEKARREGVSLRSLTLQAFRKWVVAPPVPAPLILSTPRRRRRPATKPDDTKGP